jgi:hypothetical protein
MSIPESFSRVTKNRPPRHQLYVPGFNPSNGCWLDGSWTPLPEREWRSRRAAHERLFSGVRKASAAQSHRGRRRPISSLSPAERTAYEHYSGEMTVDCRDQAGRPQIVGVRMAGKRVSEDGLRHMASNGLLAYERVRDASGRVRNQARALSLPAKLVLPVEEPFFFWKSVVAENRRRFREDALFGLEAFRKKEDHGGMGLMMFTQHLLQLEENIVREEHSLSVGEPPDPLSTLEEDRAEYAELRRGLEAPVLKAYRAARREHNGCARTNLDNTDGNLFSYVLPEFSPDGTHAPWGERDVPWNGVRTGGLMGRKRRKRRKKA